MVSDKKAGLGSKLNHGLVTESPSDRERQADQRDPRSTPPRQREPKGGHNDSEVKRKLAAAIVLQSLKDLCLSEDYDFEIADWSKTKRFSDLCDVAMINPGKVKSLIERLNSFPQRIRSDYMKKKIKEGLG